MLHYKQLGYYEYFKSTDGAGTGGILKEEIMMTNRVDDKLEEGRNGFRTQGGITDTIFTLEMILRRTRSGANMCILILSI